MGKKYHCPQTQQVCTPHKFHHEHGGELSKLKGKKIGLHKGLRDDSYDVGGGQLLGKLKRTLHQRKTNCIFGKGGTFWHCGHKNLKHCWLA